MNADFIYPTKQLYKIRVTQLQDNFGYRPPYRKSIDCKCPPGQDSKRPTNWMRPQSKRGKDEEENRLEKKCYNKEKC